MARRNKFLTAVPYGAKKWAGILKKDGTIVAIIFEQQRDTGYRYSLMSNRGKMSTFHKDIQSCLDAIEREVL